MKAPEDWTDYILSGCSDLAAAPAAMALLEKLAEGKERLLVHELRNHVATGNYEAAARLQAMAEVWAALTTDIYELASRWRERQR